MVYLDNSATTGKKPRNVIYAVNNAIANLSANPGRSGYETAVKSAEMIYNAREKLRVMFGAESVQNIIFTPGCTYSLNFVIKGILSKNDHCIVSDMEHNAVMRPLHKTGCDYSIASIDFNDSVKTVNNFESLVRPETKLVVCTAASNVFGIMPPVSKIGEMCKKHGILFAVDAAQAAGVYPIDIKKSNIDFLAIAGHKGLYAPMGTGVLILNGTLPDTLIEGGTGTFSEKIEQPEILPEMFESGTLNVPGIAGISAGADFIKSKGIGNIYGHEMRIIRIIYNEFKDNERILLYSDPTGPLPYCPVLSFNLLGKMSSETEEILARNKIAVRSGLHCAPFAHRKMNTLDTGTVRISPSVFTTDSEIAFFLNIIKKAIKN